MAVSNERSDLGALFDKARSAAPPQFMYVKDPRTGADEIGLPVLAIPDGYRLHSARDVLDPWRKAPDRRRGTATMGDLTSLIAHLNRFKAPASAVFAERNEKTPGIVGVYDYHPEGPDNAAAAFGEHRVRYAFPLSKQWKTWAEGEATWMTQAEFGEFLEANILDVMQPPKDGRSEAGALTLDLLGLLGGRVAEPAELIEVARRLRVLESSEVVNARNISTGEVEVLHKTEHRDQQGQPLKVPNLFVLMIPVFDADAAYRLPVRLRYRKKEGAILWAYERYRAEVVFFDAFDRATTRIGEETALPVFIGAPEAASPK